MKKILSILLSVVLVCTCFIFPVGADEAPALAVDISCDGTSTDNMVSALSGNLIPSVVSEGVQDAQGSVYKITQAYSTNTYWKSVFPNAVATKLPGATSTNKEAPLFTECYTKTDFMIPQEQFKQVGIKLLVGGYDSSGNNFCCINTLLGMVYNGTTFKITNDMTGHLSNYFNKSIMSDFAPSAFNPEIKADTWYTLEAKYSVSHSCLIISLTERDTGSCNMIELPIKAADTATYSIDNGIVSLAFNVVTGTPNESYLYADNVECRAVTTAQATDEEMAIVFPGGFYKDDFFSAYIANNQATITGINKDNYTVNAEDNTKLDTTASSIVIPAFIGTSPVCAISNYAFSKNADGTQSKSQDSNAYMDAITSVTFEDTTSLTQIGDYAFCGLRKINTSLIIPDSVLSIGSFSFANWANLNYSIKQMVLPKNLQTIGATAFTNTGDIAIFNVPASVSSIGTSIFRGSRCREIVFESDAAIPSGTFHNCKNLNAVVVLKTPEISDDVFSVDATPIYPGAKEIVDGTTYYSGVTFYGNDTVTAGFKTITDNINAAAGAKILDYLFSNAYLSDNAAALLGIESGVLLKAKIVDSALEKCDVVPVSSGWTDFESEDYNKFILVDDLNTIKPLTKSINK